MIDLHLHSEFSFDSKSNPKKIIEYAIKKGIEILTFTDHLDYDANLLHKDFDFDIEKYFYSLNELKKEYEGKIEILIGAEFGIQPQLLEKYKKIASNYPWDFILMSIHTVWQRDLAVDGYVEKYPPLEGLKTYYERMLEMLESFSDFDSLSHIDYLDRYYAFKKIPLPEVWEYKEDVEKVFKKIISMDKVIELNSAGLRKSLGYFHPKEELLKLYVELGGTTATFGSDAHLVHEIGEGFTETIEKAKEIGIKNISFFRQRKREDIDISQV